jgi:GNAT superfamily N-acetyltransferase
MQGPQVSVLWLSSKEKREKENEAWNACLDLFVTCFGKYPKKGVFALAVAAFEGGQAVGFAGLRKCDIGQPLYFVECMCVHPSYRRRGVAANILEKLSTLDVQKALYVEKNKNHRRMLQMYERHGFKEVKTHLFLPISTEVESLLVSERSVCPRKHSI